MRVPRIFYFILIIVSFIFTSCPCDIPEWMLENGKEIKNYPEWTTNCNAYSPWMDWQSEDGQRLHDLVDDSIIPDDFTGRFRIGLQGQNVIIGFNNQKGDYIKLYNWLGEVTSWNDSVVTVEQEDSDKFVYDCYCKRQKTEDAAKENKSKVEMTKISEESFNYKQTIAGRVVIDCEFNNLVFFCMDLGENYHTVPTNVPIKLCDYFPVEFLIEEEQFLYFYPADDSNSYQKIATFPNDFFRYIYCPEGIEFRKINEEKTTISFNLLDSKESNHADYLEIQVNSKSDVKINFYKIKDGIPVLLNTLEKPELKANWILDTKTGETEIY